MNYKTNIPSHLLQRAVATEIKSSNDDENFNIPPEFSPDDLEFLKENICESVQYMIDRNWNMLYTPLTRISNLLEQHLFNQEFGFILDFIDGFVLLNEKMDFRFDDLFMQILYEGSTSDLLCVSSRLLLLWSRNANANRIMKIFQKENLCILLNILCRPETKFLVFDKNGNSIFNVNDLSPEDKYEIRKNICHSLHNIVFNETILRDNIPIIIFQMPELIEELAHHRSIVMNYVGDLISLMINKVEPFFSNKIIQELNLSFYEYYNSNRQPDGFNGFAELALLDINTSINYLSNLNVVFNSPDQEPIRLALNILLEMLSSKDKSIYSRSMDYLENSDLFKNLTENRKYHTHLLAFLYNLYYRNTTNKNNDLMDMLLSKHIIDQIFSMASSDNDAETEPYQSRCISFILISTIMRDYKGFTEDYYIKFFSIASSFITDCYTDGINVVFACIHLAVSTPELFTSPTMLNQAAQLFDVLTQALECPEYSEYKKIIIEAIQCIETILSA